MEKGSFVLRSVSGEIHHIEVTCEDWNNFEDTREIEFLQHVKISIETRMVQYLYTI